MDGANAPEIGTAREVHPEAGLEGIVFPRVDGRRSTLTTGRAVIADALRGVDEAEARRVLAVRDWRSGYLEPYRRMTALAVTRSGATERISADGLAAVHRRFTFLVGGQEIPVSEAIAAGLDAVRVPRLHTVEVAGTRPFGQPVLSVPYRGRRLVTGELERQLDTWLRAGTTEESFADAVRAVIRHPEWLDLRDLTVVVLGAGAQLGPLVSLLQWGAHVVAVDLPGFACWNRLIQVARTSPGRMSLPVSRWLPASVSDAELATAAGADVLTRTPDLFAWLSGLPGPYVLGNYVYADGAVHVRASVAVDALTAALTADRPDISLAFLATPTDVFPVPQDAVREAWRRYEGRTVVRRVGRFASGGRALRRNYDQLLTLPDGRHVGLNDSLVPQQGPNYALAKRIQRWRALHERSAGRLVSLNVAPATRTRSVVRNRLLAAGYAGAHRFGMEVFDPSTSNTLMAALLVHDVRNPDAVANPARVLSHPMELFWQGANHGGLWRLAYSPRSVLDLAVILGMVQRGA